MDGELDMNMKIVLATCLVSALITACSSRDDNTPTNDMDTEEVKVAALRSLGGNFDGNATAVGTVLNRNSDVLTGTLGDVAVGGSEQLPTEVETDLEIQERVQSLLSASLGIDESDNSTTTRVGNTILIDPDETMLCADDTLDDFSSDVDQQHCEELMKDLTVELLATGEEAGVVTYKFQTEDLISFGYGGNTEYSEIHFAGFKTLLNANSMVTNGEELDGLPSTIQGSLRASATVTNDKAGSEAGSLQYDVASPIRIVSTTEKGTTDITLDTGTLFKITADTVTGAGSLSFDAGALSVIAPTDSGVGRLNLEGYTGSAEINPENGDLVVRDLGLSKGPFSFSIDNTEVLKMTLSAFGFTTTEGTDLEPGEVIIDGDMDLSVVVNSVTDFELDDELASAILNVMIPDSTSVSRAGNGNSKVGGVGPLTVSYTTTDNLNMVDSKSVTVNSGECFITLLDEDAAAPSTELCE